MVCESNYSISTSIPKNKFNLSTLPFKNIQRDEIQSIQRTFWTVCAKTIKKNIEYKGNSYLVSKPTQTSSFDHQYKKVHITMTIDKWKNILFVYEPLK